MVDINWNILQPVDVGANFQSGFAMGQQIVEKHNLKSALAAYSQNPSDPAATNALAAASPEFAMRIAAQRYGEQKDDAERKRVGSYFSNPNLDESYNAALQDGDTATAKIIAGLSDDQRKKVQDMYQGAAPFAYEASKLPYEQRKAYITSIAPQLKAFGWDDSHLASFDPTDGQLNNLMTTATTLEQKRSEDKPQVIPLTAGGSAVARYSDGRVENLIMANPGDKAPGSPVGSRPLVHITGEKDYNGLQDGDHYTFDGVHVLTKGGQASAPGNFLDPLAPR